MRERDTVKALRGVTALHLRLWVTDEERALLKEAAGRQNWSVSRWAEVNLMDLAQVETMSEAVVRK